MKCPKCGYNYCDMISETKQTGKDYSIGRGICGEILFGPYGSICGWTEGKKTDVEVYWVCKKCNFKFKA